MTKDLKELALDITEKEYRELPYMHYSALSRYAKEGFSALDSLEEKIESPSLKFGSMVDTLITEGFDVFNNKFLVVEEVLSSEGVKNIVQDLFNKHKDSCAKLADIPKNIVLSVAREQGFRNTWKDDTIYKHLIDNGTNYYDLLYLSQDKIMVSAEEYTKAINTYNTLKESASTRSYFKTDDVFDNNIKRYYQLKFVHDYLEVKCKIMLDLVIVNYSEKIIIPVDLKTTSLKEWDFPKAYVNYRYDLQASLYWSVLNDILKEDPYFKDFTLYPFRFICINKDNLKPLVWEDDTCDRLDTVCYPAKPLRFESAGSLIREVVENTGKEYPVNIKEVGVNNIAKHLYGKVI